MRHILTLTTALFLLTTVPACADSDTLGEILAQNRYPLRLEDGGLAGEGAAFLTQAAKSARYVLVGEDHGVAEVHRFTEALWHALSPLDFETYVTEVGPWSARHLLELAESPRSGAAFAEFYERYPATIPFAFYREEAELLAAVAEVSEAEVPIWGIDQEFFLGPRLHLDELARRAEGEAKKELEALAEAERGVYRTIVAERSPSVPSFMNRPLPESWSRIREHFTERGDEEALALVRGLEESHEIYGYFFSGQGYLNNHVRARLMKANLGRYFTRYGDGRRLLVKLGANHVMRGLSTLGVSDVGNFLAEKAELHGEESLHLLVMATSGTRNGWLPFLPAEAQKMPIDLETPGYASFRPLLEAFEVGEGWSVYDLRPLRAKARKWAGGSADAEAVMRGFDAVVIFGEARAAELFATLLPQTAGKAR